MLSWTKEALCLQPRQISFFFSHLWLEFCPQNISPEKSQGIEFCWALNTLRQLCVLHSSLLIFIVLRLLSKAYYYYFFPPSLFWTHRHWANFRMKFFLKKLEFEPIGYEPTLPTTWPPPRPNSYTLNPNLKIVSAAATDVSWNASEHPEELLQRGHHVRSGGEVDAAAAQDARVVLRPPSSHSHWNRLHGWFCLTSAATHGDHSLARAVGLDCDPCSDVPITS